MELEPPQSEPRLAMVDSTNRQISIKLELGFLVPQQGVAVVTRYGGALRQSLEMAVSEQVPLRAVEHRPRESIH